MTTKDFKDFLKSNDAYRKFKRELEEEGVRLEDSDDIVYYLSDGYFFYWEDAVTTADWYMLDRKWVELVLAKGVL